MFNQIKQHIKKNFQMILMVSFFILSVVFFVHISVDHFIIGKPNISQIENEIYDLGDIKYEGRLTGSSGNELALNTVIAELDRLKIPHSLQSFNLSVPQVDTTPTFQIRNGTPLTNSTRNFELYKDYAVITSYNGGGIEYKGQIYLAGSDFLRVDPANFKDRIVVIETGRIQTDYIDYVVKSGAKGVLLCTNTNPNPRVSAFDDVLKKDVSTQQKNGDTAFLAYISGYMNAELKKMAIDQIVDRVEVNIDVQFPILKSANLIAEIEGTKSSETILILSTNFDGLGVGPQPLVFNQASKNISGSVALLEVARKLKMQTNMPFNKILLCFWNGQGQGNVGSNFYLNHPYYSLDHTTLIHLDGLGLNHMPSTLIQADNQESAIAKDLLHLFSQSRGLKVEKTSSVNSVVNSFVDNGAVAISLSQHDSDKYPTSVIEDNIDQLDPLRIQEGVDLVLNYINGVYYPKSYLSLFTTSEKMFLVILTLILFLFAGKSKFLRNLIYYVTAIMVLAFLVNIRQSTDIRYVNGILSTNFSFYLALEQTVLFFREFISLLFNQSAIFFQSEIISSLKEASRLTIILLASTIGIAYVLGILMGLLESYRPKGSSLRALNSLVLFSVPDVFVVLVCLLGYTFVTKIHPNVIEFKFIKAFILPIFSLSLIPTIYISRITSVAIYEELQKDYVRGAYALGYTKFQLYFKIMMPAILIKVLDAMPTLLGMIFSNMIIVEYLFNYNGVGYLLLYLYKRQDAMRFVPLAIELGLIYFLVLGLSKFISSELNPRHRGGTHD